MQIDTPTALDQLVIGGTASLSGTLNVSSLGSSFSEGETFALLSYSALDPVYNTFSSVNTPLIYPLWFQPQYGDQSFSLVVQPILP
jgi:hypothetical protein